MKMQPDDPTPEQEAMRELHGEILGLREQLREAVRLLKKCGEHGEGEIEERMWLNEVSGFLAQNADIAKEIEAGN